MPSVVKSIALASGLKLEYVEQGDPAGVPVVLLHGGTDSWRSFEPVLPYLPETVRALALSQRGHGGSDRPAAGYLFPQFAADVADFMDAIGIEAAVVVGHSMGASVAQRFAIDYPGRTLGVVLAGAFFSFRANQVYVELTETEIPGLVDPIPPAFVREFQESTLAQPVPPAFLDAVVAESLKVPARVWKAAFTGMLDEDFPEEMGKIRTPTLLVWGDQDGFRHRGDQDALVATIAGARLLVYAGAGHAVHWEEPERFASDLLDFVREVGG